ncbi:TetR/AcrR family transcriptional regulator [Microbacterium sp. Marseille-Q6965]|uniref:TetR/AcrR family transcriptional regulator n=1 Tax=Microbacterium sp. Marseille-Q6965 TaxID=2965072 RepID=UPI0021B77E79|nr:TetR/AcrR family transcriptional regulator [Microbacterium sp. Marseille-Q6965]
MQNAAGRPGRPKAISREMLAEAACELFLERGFDDTSVADIARRAGIARSSFFNYAPSKSSLLWAGLDERIDALAADLGAGADPAAAVVGMADGFAPDALALAYANVAAMGIEAELERESALRLVRMGRLVAEALRRRGEGELAADVAGAAYGAAVIASIRHWSRIGPGARPLIAVLREALAAVPGARAGQP